MVNVMLHLVSIYKNTSAALVYNRNGKASGFWRVIRCHFRGYGGGERWRTRWREREQGEGKGGDVEEEVGSQGKEDEGDTR